MVPLFFSYKGTIWVYPSIAVLTPNPTSLSSFGFVLFIRHIPGTRRLPVAWNLAFATYHLPCLPAQLKLLCLQRAERNSKSSQITKQRTEFTFTEQPCQDKDRRSGCLRGGLNHHFIKERNGAAGFPRGSRPGSRPAEPRLPWGTQHKHARARRSEQRANTSSFPGSYNALA